MIALATKSTNSSAAAFDKAKQNAELCDAPEGLVAWSETKWLVCGLLDIYNEYKNCIVTKLLHPV